MSEVSSQDRVFAAWTQGRRERQEDNCGMVDLDPSQTKNYPDILVVADGMGGQTAGQVASDLAVSAFLAHAQRTGELEAPVRLRQALEHANAEISEQTKNKPELKSMGTTLLAVEIGAGRIQWISVGDSPLLLVRGKAIQYLNQNHSLAGLYSEMVNKGELSAVEAAARGGQNQLRSALTGAPPQIVDEGPGNDGFELLPGDTLILASDGLLTLDLDRITKIVRSKPNSAREIAESLIAAVNEADKPEQDNATVIVYVEPGGRTESRKSVSISPGFVVASVAVSCALFLLALAYLFMGHGASLPS